MGWCRRIGGFDGVHRGDDVGVLMDLVGFIDGMV